MSVLELVEAFSRAAGHKIPYQFSPRSTGDDSTSCADTSYAEKKLGWHATHTIDEACQDVWRWLNSKQENK